jgi:hypothetical protein
MKLSREQIEGIIRHTLTAVGGFLITKGILDENLVMDITGAAITLTGIIWSIIDKNKKA